MIGSDANTGAERSHVETKRVFGALPVTIDSRTNTGAEQSHAETKRVFGALPVTIDSRTNTGAEQSHAETKVAAEPSLCEAPCGDFCFSKSESIKCERGY